MELSRCAALELLRRRGVCLNLAEWARLKEFKPAKHRSHLREAEDHQDAQTRTKTVPEPLGEA
jgi:hypothetical protein